MLRIWPSVATCTRACVFLSTGRQSYRVPVEAVVTKLRVLERSRVVCTAAPQGAFLLTRPFWLPFLLRALHFGALSLTLFVISCSLIDFLAAVLVSVLWQRRAHGLWMCIWQCRTHGGLFLPGGPWCFTAFCVAPVAPGARGRVGSYVAARRLTHCPPQKYGRPVS